jgi:hypothetical protein
MDIETIKQAKRQCESEVRAILNMFEQQSDCEISGIDFKRPRLFGIKRNPIEMVSLDVRIK